MIIPQRVLKFSENDYENLIKIHQIKEKFTKFQLYNTIIKREITDLRSLPVNLDNSTRFVQISSNELFFVGPKTFLNRGAGVIDVTSSTVSRIFPSFKDYFFNFGLIYWDECVYVFGRTKNTETPNRAKKLSFRENRWIELAALPSGLINCSCAFFKHSILLSGWGKDLIYQYNVDLDSYSDIKGIVHLYSKLMFVAERRVFVIEGKGRIIESDIEDEYSWNIVGKSHLTVNFQFFWIRNKDDKESIYISGYSKNGSNIPLYKFDIKTKEIAQITISNIYE